MAEDLAFYLNFSGVETGQRVWERSCLSQVMRVAFVDLAVRAMMRSEVFRRELFLERKSVIKTRNLVSRPIVWNKFKW